MSRHLTRFMLLFYYVGRNTKTIEYMVCITLFSGKIDIDDDRQASEAIIRWL